MAHSTAQAARNWAAASADMSRGAETRVRKKARADETTEAAAPLSSLETSTREATRELAAGSPG